MKQRRVWYMYIGLDSEVESLHGQSKRIGWSEKSRFGDTTNISAEEDLGAGAGCNGAAHVRGEEREANLVCG